MATILYTDVRYYSAHFESMAAQWRQFDSAIRRLGAIPARYFRNREAKRYLRSLPDYLLDDIGIDRSYLY
ncbi:MAG: DUF1127 domain-containing protein [Pseudomonadota bacterium]